MHLVFAVCLEQAGHLILNPPVLQHFSLTGFDKMNCFQLLPFAFQDFFHAALSEARVSAITGMSGTNKALHLIQEPPVPEHIPLSPLCSLFDKTNWFQLFPALLFMGVSSQPWIWNTSCLLQCCWSCHVFLLTEHLPVMTSRRVTSWRWPGHTTVEGLVGAGGQRNVGDSRQWDRDLAG